jgi:hypothetical protein
VSHDVTLPFPHTTLLYDVLVAGYIPSPIHLLPLNDVSRPF